MKPLILPADMRACEERYFAESGVKSIDVMERAAQALADRLCAALPTGSTVYFACGTGGNGGDGLACARLLHRQYRCVIVQPQPPRTPDAIENLHRARECGIGILTEPPTEVPDGWVDALFGTGLRRAPGQAYAQLILRMNCDREGGAFVLSADIPSGLDGATGRAFDPCVRADCTITFQKIKAGLVLADGLDACGELSVADIGIPKSALCAASMGEMCEPSDVQCLLPRRPRNVHKGDCGHLLIVAGSLGMAGAAAMCARAALRSGVGLLTIACVQSIVPILQTLAPQAMCIPLDEDGGAIAIDALQKLKDALRGKDAVVIGPGLTRRVPSELVRAVLESGLPAVIDADALNLLSERRELLSRLEKHHILTPHPGEAARLIPDLAAFDPIAAARSLSALGSTVLYKGASCVVTDGDKVYVSRSGGCGMARGGSGDILSGIMGALLAEKSGRSFARTAALASEIHGLAGELAQGKYGCRGMNAMDILEFLPEVLPK